MTCQLDRPSTDRSRGGLTSPNALAATCHATRNDVCSLGSPGVVALLFGFYTFDLTRRVKRSRYRGSSPKFGDQRDQRAVSQKFTLKEVLLR